MRQARKHFNSEPASREPAHQHDVQASAFGAYLRHEAKENTKAAFHVATRLIFLSGIWLSYDVVQPGLCRPVVTVTTFF